MNQELPLITDLREITPDMMDEMCNGCEPGEVADNE